MMITAFSPGHNKTVAIMGADNFARGGLSNLIQEISPRIHIRASVREQKVLDLFLSQTAVDILFISDNKSGIQGYDCISYLQQLKETYPGMTICIYSACSSLYFWACGAVDDYLSTDEPIYSLRYRLKRILENRRGTLNRFPVQRMSLTHAEWKVLKGIKSGFSMHHIAHKEEIPYRRVSALKTSAIRKLGLRNKTDLLVFLTS